MRKTTIAAVLAAATCAAALPAAASAKPAGAKQATFKATLSGSQVTTWEYHHAQDDDNPCDASSNGYGDQTIKFTAGRKFNITFTAPPKKQPDLFGTNGRPGVITAPIFLPLDATAERNGDYSVNYGEIQSGCDGASGGDDGIPTPKDCGVRKGGFQGLVYFHPSIGGDGVDFPTPHPFPEKNTLKLEGLSYEWQTPEGSQSTLFDAYKNCPMLLRDADVDVAGNIYTSPAKLSEKALFNKKRKRIVVSGDHIAKHNAGGSTGQTILAWNLRLTRVK
jgi:hypothetical protein